MAQIKINYPQDQISQPTLSINNQTHDITGIMELLSSDQMIMAVKDLKDQHGLSLKDATEICRELKTILPGRKVEVHHSEPQAAPRQNTLGCPKCGSTVIDRESSEPKRLAKLFGRKSAICVNCGHSWNIK